MKEDRNNDTTGTAVDVKALANEIRKSRVNKAFNNTPINSKQTASKSPLAKKLGVGEMPSRHSKRQAMSDEAVQWLVENKGVNYVNYDTGEGMENLPVATDKKYGKTFTISGGVKAVQRPKPKPKIHKPKKDTYASMVADKLSDGKLHNVETLLFGKTKEQLVGCVAGLRRRSTDMIIFSELYRGKLVGFQLISYKEQRARAKTKKPKGQTYIAWLKSKLLTGDVYSIDELMNGRTRQFFHDCKSKLVSQGMIIEMHRKDDGIYYQCEVK